MVEAKDGCVSPAGGPILDTPEASTEPKSQSTTKEAMKMSVRVGQSAPDFEAAAYIDGGFRNIKLSDFRGQWVVLCFYPGDFTFV